MDGRRLRFAKAVIATGARAALPPIPGLAQARPHTNETIFELRERPRRLAVIGGGPIGAELAQAFRRLGCEVTLLEAGARLLPREDADAAEIVQRRLAAEGVRAAARRERRAGRAARRANARCACAARDGAVSEVLADEILVAVGRAPNVEGMNLESAGRRVRCAHGRRRERSPPDHESAHLRGRRRLHELEVHARGRRRGEDRGAERAVRAHASGSRRW